MAAALVGYTFVQMPMDINSPYVRGFRSTIALRRIIHKVFARADNGAQNDARISSYGRQEGRPFDGMLRGNT